jgi:uncharacterized repeat protein (TIGR01451 family)
MSGYQYRVTVSNGAGSVTSDAATLTVYKTGPVVWADVSIAKEGSYDSGTKTITWTITVTNDGPQQAQGVMVKDTLASGTKFSSFDPMASGATAKVGGRTVTVNIIGTLASGNSCTFKIYALVTRATAPFENTAAVTTTSYDRDPSDNTVNPSVSWP